MRWSECSSHHEREVYEVIWVQQLSWAGGIWGDLSEAAIMSRIYRRWSECSSYHELEVYEVIWVQQLSWAPARGRVGRVTDGGVKGLGFKSPGSILTSRTETGSLSRVVRDGWDPWSVPWSGWKKVSSGGVVDLAVEQPQLIRKLHKNKNKNEQEVYEVVWEQQLFLRVLHVMWDPTIWLNWPAWVGSYYGIAFINWPDY